MWIELPCKESVGHQMKEYLWAGMCSYLSQRYRLGDSSWRLIEARQLCWIFFSFATQHILIPLSVLNEFSICVCVCLCVCLILSSWRIPPMPTWFTYGISTCMRSLQTLSSLHLSDSLSLNILYSFYCILLTHTLTNTHTHTLCLHLCHVWHCQESQVKLIVSVCVGLRPTSTFSPTLVDYCLNNTSTPRECQTAWEGRASTSAG